MNFPDGFLWGSATAAHQIEGNNWANDWWAWEHTPGSPCTAPSGDACDFYHRYPEDLALVAKLGQKVFRFSIEWARVEPEDGEFSTAAMNHYARVLSSCYDNGLTPMVTLHHFTSPRWFAARGGWESSASADLFGRYSRRVMNVLGRQIPYVCTINEPNIVAAAGWVSGYFPPGKRDRELRKLVSQHFIAAHGAAVDAVRETSNAQVGLTLSMTEYQAIDGGDDRVARLRENMEDIFLRAVAEDGSDFLGVQVYSRSRVNAAGQMGPEPGVETTQMGYEFWPQALAACVRRATAITGKPAIVTENGIGTADDARRIAFTDAALRGLHAAIADGVDVRGYVHWSTMDNFECVLGYRPTFGLISVDRETQARRPKPSAEWFADVCRRNGLS